MAYTHVIILYNYIYVHITAVTMFFIEVTFAFAYDFFIKIYKHIKT